MATTLPYASRPEIASQDFLPYLGCNLTNFVSLQFRLDKLKLQGNIFYRHWPGFLSLMYYLHTHDGLEIDLLIELENKLYLIEVKSSATIKPEHVSSLKRAKKDFGRLAEKTLIISNSKESFLLSQGVFNLSYREILLR